MSEDETDPATDRERLSLQSITDRIDSLSPGDEISFNDRDARYEVVETDRYSITVVGPNDDRLTLSQNLQTGGWAVHEELWWIGSDRSAD
ncbi:transcriptional regulator [Halosolutus amylolyticus]|uniref:Transcriptional regulator n=1 Tax=Halosolutus amylolyticus TaxID=2932267 RepID=A0ABD5PQZ7_9EURY|nr:transcriptional regulator [Halosolutus amylolyticus]